MAIAQSFDAIGAARELREAGVDPRQAEALAQIVHQATVLSETSDLVTKTDFATIKLEFTAEIERAKSSAIVVILSGMALLSSATVAAVKLIH